MITKKQKTAFVKFFVSLFRMRMPKADVSVRLLGPESTELGFTYRRKNKMIIHLNANQDGALKEYFEDLDDTQALLFVLGVGIHEFMHQILTNFVLFKKAIEAYPDKKAANLFKTVFNIFEDSRIESYAPSYFAGETLTALNFSIKHIWEVSPEIDPESQIINQVIGAMIQYGDLGCIKPELSEEAKELFDKIKLLFDEAIDSKSCAICINRAKKATEILLPYADDLPEYEDSSDSDSEGEDATDSDESKSAREKKIGSSPKRSSASASDESKDSEESKSEDSEEEKSKESSSHGESGTGEISEKGGSIYRDGCEDEECDSFSDDPEEVEDDTEATEEDFRKAMESLEKTLESLEKAEDEALEENESDYCFEDTECPSGDKYVKVISHHKAASDPDAYESYKTLVGADAHELAKLIKRQFKTKPGRVKRSDHGDLNLMRYKDPNFRSPLIFDKKKPREKHSAAVMLVVDESGSMSGKRIQNARLAAIMLAEAMAEAGIPCCVVGHSGDSKYDCSVELEHYTTFKNTPADRTSMAMISARCQNRDGPTIRWASSILKKRPEKNKLMIVISDGQPAADRYSGTNAIFDTKAAIRDAKRLHSIVGIVLEAGSATDILKTMYGNDWVECNSAKNLKSCIEQVIINQCKNW